MQTRLSLPRIFTVLAALAIVVLGFPFAALAADPPTRLQVLSVKAGETVSVRAHNFPANQLFIVMMDADGNNGANGTRVTLTNSGAGGTFDETYAIPPALKNVARLVIRLQSEKGETVVFAPFTNQTGIPWDVTLTPSATPLRSPTATLTGSPTAVVTRTATAVRPTPAITFASTETGGKPRVAILGVIENQLVSLRATNFPANQEFVIRVGPYATFFTKYVTMGKINSGQGGTLLIDLALPPEVKGVSLVTVRFDGGGVAAYNAFFNRTSGTGRTAVPNPSATPTPKPSPTPASTLTPTKQVLCQVLSARTSVTPTRGNDFDAIWEVRNTAGYAWDQQTIDLVYVSGAEMRKKTRYDLPATLASGSSLKLIADMRAPTTAGTYTETWAIRNGTVTLCTLNITVTVK